MGLQFLKVSLTIVLIFLFAKSFYAIERLRQESSLFLFLREFFTLGGIYYIPLKFFYSVFSEVYLSEGMRIKREKQKESNLVGNL